MARIHELRLIAKVARMYYQQEIKQSKIAEILNISQSSVSRLLKSAIENKIVHISVHDPAGSYLDLEEAITQKYKLKQAVVVDSEVDEESIIINRLGEAAAYYLETTLRKNAVVGISSWSVTLLNMINNLRSQSLRNTGGKVVQILGGTGSPQVQTHATHMITRFCEVTGAEGYFLPANSVTPSVSAKLTLLKDPHIRTTFSLFSQIDVALVGIGSIEPSDLLAQSGNILTQEQQKRLSQEGAVGDICLRFFDEDGKPVSKEFDDNIIGISLDELKSISQTIAVAGGKRKFSAIKGALLGRYCNCLITDRFTAERLCEV